MPGVGPVTGPGQGPVAGPATDRGASLSFKPSLASGLGWDYDWIVRFEDLGNPAEAIEAISGSDHLDKIGAGTTLSDPYVGPWLCGTTDASGEFFRANTSGLFDVGNESCVVVIDCEIDTTPSGARNFVNKLTGGIGWLFQISTAGFLVFRCDDNNPDARPSISVNHGTGTRFRAAGVRDLSANTAQLFSTLGTSSTVTLNEPHATLSNGLLMTMGNTSDLAIKFGFIGMGVGAKVEGFDQAAFDTINVSP